MRHSTETKDIDAALAKAQGAIKTAVKDSLNPHYKSRYADLASVVDAARPELSKNNLAVTQGAYHVDGMWVLTTRLTHSSGQWYESDFPLLARDQSAQAMGSAMTYAKRYSYAAMVGVVTDDEDDDAEAASGRPMPSSPKPVPTPSQPVKAWAPTEKQLSRLFAISHAAGYGTAEAKALLASRYKKQTTKELTQAEYDDLCAYIEANPVASKPGDFNAP